MFPGVRHRVHPLGVLLVACCLSGGPGTTQDLSLDDLRPASAPSSFPLISSETRATVRPPLPDGALELVVETVRERTPNRISMMATRVEVWRGDHPLSILTKGDDGVDEEFRRRRFRFPPIPLPKGYHFITVRAYAEGPISRDQKWKGDTFQVGIDPGKTVKITRNVSFFVW